jgi:glycosyltransferase involved in cell wall biosynthesis
VKILIINWRSIKDPLEGGAERATFEFSKRWIQKHKAEVVWLSPTYDYKIKSETIDGIKFEYIGLPLNRNVFWLLIVFPLFYFLVIYKYLTKFKGKVDIVIDQVHGIPYLTPLYVKEKIAVYIHEVAGEIWGIMYPLPIRILGQTIEKLIFNIYKIFKIHFIANSNSTYTDLVEKVGISNELIQIAPYGVTAPHTNFENLPHKEKDLTVVYLNRIVKMKGIERGLKVFAITVREFPNAKMWVIGKGENEFIEQLTNQVKDLGIEKNVEFIGFKDGHEKYNLLGRAHVLMNPSYLEGFGLVNIEANRMGTPAVVFNVRGCRDSVQNGINGLLAENDDLEAMAENIKKLYTSLDLRKTSWEYSNQFDWDIQAEIFYRKLEEIKNEKTDFKN